ncbi:MAG: heparinase II/III-family protein, partial [Xanthomonadales bacterium]|nr:heparinase II/III-family protein [Xanthomonadales bacterium]
PDGYYTEGPYYQRYALYPFLVFTQALNNSKPELNIFEIKNGALVKAVDALLNLSDANGDFFPLNDAQKGMSIYNESVVTAVDIAYHVGGKDPQLLSIAEDQGRVLLDDSGFSVAAGLRDGKSQPYQKRSVNLGDGADGHQGGVAVLRSGDQELVFKYTAQGLSHGHYDKLSFSLYERGNEVLQDYGMVRLVNVEQKGGGNYLDENATWAKQSISHNTLTIDETSHFGGDYDIGSEHHSVLQFFHASDPDLQVVSAVESNAYPGTEMRRTMALIRNPGLEVPFVLDIFMVRSEQSRQYDLPFYFLGQVIDVNFEYETPGELRALGREHGYQHLFLEGAGTPAGDSARVSWMENGKFHTLTTATNTNDELLFARIGANDPDFNLRREPAFILRRANTRDTVFASTIESHGSYDPVTESAINSRSNIAALQVAFDSPDYTAVSVRDLAGSRRLFIVASDASGSAEHQLEIAGRVYGWSGPFHYVSMD